MSSKVYVGNLPFATTEEDLREHFEKFGTVIDVKVVMDRDTGRSRGFGFVTLEDTEKALNEGNNSSLGGRTIIVTPAREREKRERDRRR